MRVGLVDVDGHNFPNIPLMKLSAWHKQRGDSVEWYTPLISGHMDIVYLAKVFSFTKDFNFPIDADKIVKGGSGYCIELENGKEVYHAERDAPLPYDVEHIYPDYSIYPELTKNTAFGFLTRGCPRGCSFCHVGKKEGLRSYKVADLSEFWNGQKNIVLCDPNILACKDRNELLQQLIDSNAYIDFNQGIDIRLVDENIACKIGQLKINNLHFAWDRYDDKEQILPKLKMLKDATKFEERKLTVYVLVNFDTTLEQDLERISTLRQIGYTPYVMIYNKQNVKPNAYVLQLQRWVNNRRIYRKCKTFAEYDPNATRKRDNKEIIPGQTTILK